MSRIAEFADEHDALRFCRLKGEKDFTVCGGINMPYAVRWKERTELAAGTFEPADLGVIRGYDDPDDFDMDLEDRNER